MHQKNEEVQLRPNKENGNLRKIKTKKLKNGSHKSFNKIRSFKRYI